MDDEKGKQRFSAKKLLFFVVSPVLIISSVSIFFIFFGSHDPIPKNIRSQAGFTVYYPQTLPQHWSLDKTSVYTSSSDRVVGYLLRGPRGNLNITIQPVPKNFDFTDFYTKRLSGTVQFLTPLGQGAIGRASNQLVGSLVTTSSWVLASPSSSNITEADIQFVLSRLRVAS